MCYRNRGNGRDQTRKVPKARQIAAESSNKTRLQLLRRNQEQRIAANSERPARREQAGVENINGERSVPTKRMNLYFFLEISYKHRTFHMYTMQKQLQVRSHLPKLPCICFLVFPRQLMLTETKCMFIAGLNLITNHTPQPKGAPVGTGQ